MDAFSFTILGAPRTKKNSQIKTRYGIVQSKAYREYEDIALRELMLFPGLARKQVADPVNVKYLFYLERETNGDLNGYTQAVDDILVKGGVLKDDNHHIVKAHDGSRVFIDRKNPRVEVTITLHG